MTFAYTRLRVFYGLMSGFQRRQRLKRMEAFLRVMPLKPGSRVLDLGGSQSIWEGVVDPLHVTLLNLPGHTPAPTPSHHNFVHVDGDACKVHLPPGYDVVFSNSVIEHVGNDDNQAAFAREVRRMGSSYWVQTPSKWFPVEAHSGMLFWWLYPETLRRSFIERWRGPLPDWTRFVEDTRVLTRKRLQLLFPEATIYTERVFGMPKSYSAWFVKP